MRTIFDFLRGRDGDSPDLEVTVEINRDVEERILSSVLNSDIEEGGKFIGRIEQTGSDLLIKVETYIDSGPRVDNSTVHLHPDGEYQEALFRIIEHFDSDIEHLGSWHSHHCNGADELSSGDIRGYFRSVNNPQYNLDFFYVLLVTRVVGRTLKAKHFLFQRGLDKYFELDESNVRIVRGSHLLESVIQEFERKALAYRGGYRGSSRRSQAQRIERTQTDDPLRVLRAADSKWIREFFPSAEARRNKKDGCVLWQWLVPLDAESIQIRYTYPTPPFKSRILQGHFEASFQNAVILSKTFPLDEHRQRTVMRFIDEVAEQVLRT